MLLFSHSYAVEIFEKLRIWVGNLCLIDCFNLQYSPIIEENLLFCKSSQRGDVNFWTSWPSLITSCPNVLFGVRNTSHLRGKSPFWSCFAGPSGSGGETQTAYWFLSQLYQEWHYESSTSTLLHPCSHLHHMLSTFLHSHSFSLTFSPFSTFSPLFSLQSFPPVYLSICSSPLLQLPRCNSLFTRIWLVLEY